MQESGIEAEEKFAETIATNQLFMIADAVTGD